MHLFSEPQLRQLLDYDATERKGSILDVGSGDGNQVLSDCFCVLDSPADSPIAAEKLWAAPVAPLRYSLGRSCPPVNTFRDSKSIHAYKNPCADLHRKSDVVRPFLEIFERVINSWALICLDFSGKLSIFQPDIVLRNHFFKNIYGYINFRKEY